MNRNHIVTIIAMTALWLAPPVLAEEQGDAHEHARQQHGSGMEQQMGHDHGDHQAPITGEDVFLIRKDIDDYQVSFHVMQVEESMQHGGTHNFMAKVEKDGAALTDLVVNSKVTHPNGESESKMLMKMGNWYMAGYDLTHEGDHQLMVLFKTADGLKHFGGVYYPMHME